MLFANRQIDKILAMGILWILFWGTSTLIALVGFFAFYFTRSSKDMPKSLSELKSEIYWQYHGVRGLVEDSILKRKNRVGECKICLLYEQLIKITTFCRTI